MIKAVPKIDRNPRTIQQNATHYGYVAYHDIALGSTHKVQPDNSPYYHVLPCRELIPFTNIEVGEVDMKRYGNEQDPIVRRQKTAYECAQEMEISYADWAFQVLHPLTGYSSEDAFRIFQVVQPFHYKLKDIQFEVGTQAEERIENGGTATYEGETVELPTLSEAEKEVAREVQRQLMVSIDIAVDTGLDKQHKTLASMTERLAGGTGKSTPDPLDKYLANEFGTDLPKLLATEKNKVQEQQAVKEQESVELKKRELELKERELALKEQELAILQRQDAKPKKPKEE